MISLPLLKREMKASWKIFLIFTAVLAMYVSVILSMYDPEIENILAEFEKVLPSMMAAVGMTLSGKSSMVGYASTYLFGFIMIIFPMIFSIILSNRLIAKYVDSGSIVYLLATPNKRSKIAVTQALVLILSLALLILFTMFLGIIYCALAFPGEMDYSAFIRLYAGVFGLHTAISGLGFFASCISDETKLSYTLSAGIPIACYIIQMMANQGGKLQRLKYFTFFTLFSPEKIIDGDSNALWMILSLYLAGILLYILGCNRFTKRNLPI